jgi:dTDP-4-amino-4,6-dideoxygalactose transaminase
MSGRSLLSVSHPPVLLPLVDFAAEFDSIKDDTDAAIADALRWGNFILGPQVSAFERTMA